MNEKNKVISTILLAGTFNGKWSNDLHLQCVMEDGSTWNCDLEGNIWEKVGLSFKELTDKFNEADRK